MVKCAQHLCYIKFVTTKKNSEDRSGVAVSTVRPTVVTSTLTSCFVAIPKTMASGEKKRRNERLFDNNWQHEFFFAIANTIKKPRVLFAARASLR